MSRQRFLENSAPIDADLLAAGANPSSLIEHNADSIIASKEAVKVFLDHLDKGHFVYDVNVRMSMILALRTKAADQYWDEIKRQFLRSSKDDSSGGLATEWANAVADSAHSKANKLKLAHLLKDRSLGRIRLLMLPALKRMNDPEIVAVIVELLDDPELRTALLQWKGFWKRHKPDVLES